MRLHTPEKQEKLECQKADPATDTDSDTDTVPSAKQVELIAPLFLAARRVPQVCCITPAPGPPVNLEEGEKKASVSAWQEIAPVSLSGKSWGHRVLQEVSVRAACHLSLLPPGGLLRGQEV